MKSKPKKIILWAGGFLLAGVLLLSLVWWQEYRQQGLLVTFFDVGQGDSILIRTPSHQTILIDGGPDSGVLNKLGRALPFYDHTIDLVVLTHAHADHLDGLIPVLERYDVRQVLYNGVQTKAQDFIAWQNLIMKKNINMTVAEANEVFKFGETSFTVLYPFNDISQEAPKDLNDSSVVTRLVYQDTSFLFTGDAPVGVEEQLLQYGDELKSDVLKIGHHGSKYSSSDGFLKEVGPEYAIILSGIGNKFGHPHQITLTKLERLNANTLRTDAIGSINMVSDGYRVSVK